MYFYSPPYLFHPPAFETFLKDRLEYLFRNALDLEKESLDFKTIVPSEEEARLCLQTNHTLRAKLEIRWSGSEKVCSFSFPYPALVFLSYGRKHPETDVPEGGCGIPVWSASLVYGCFANIPLPMGRGKQIIISGWFFLRAGIWIAYCLEKTSRTFSPPFS